MAVQFDIEGPGMDMEGILRVDTDFEPVSGSKLEFSAELSVTFVQNELG